ncbi:type IV toxin-antitoxin system AbiEi family antitoxin [Reichenbachiella faecimaris]|nr:type IV toxin-antitoxin system AbiEi family antitoxin [Reichenbachiella faecimaris]
MERKIINTAIANLSNFTGVTGAYKPAKVLDGKITIAYKGKKHDFTVEVKKDVKPYIVEQLQALKKQYPDLILIAERIPQATKRKLEELTIPYIEANGNMYLETPDMFIHLETIKPIKITKETGNRAFTKTGLKVVFQLLINPELINKTQREIAKITGVALGNIPQVIDGLKETGYLLPLNKRTYIWEKKEELIERWIDGYQTTLKPTLKKNTYAIRGDWQDLKLTNGTVWGGEPAADLLTNHLRPEIFTLYTKETQIDLIKNYKLQPKPTGELTTLEKFWNEDIDQMAPAILVYADLKLTGGKRNNETAQIIYNEHIKPNL